MNEPKYKVGEAVWIEGQPGIIKKVRVAQSPYYKRPCNHYTIHISHDVDAFEYHVTPRMVPRYSDNDIVLINIPEGDWQAKVKYSHADDEGKNIYEVELITRKFTISEDKIKVELND